MSTKYTSKDNNTYWMHNGKYHREDGPAIERTDGTKAWYIHGDLHREDGPAIERTDGTKAWFIHGRYHREDGPAVEYTDGAKNGGFMANYTGKMDMRLNGHMALKNGICMV